MAPEPPVQQPLEPSVQAHKDEDKAYNRGVPGDDEEFQQTEAAAALPSFQLYHLAFCIYNEHQVINVQVPFLFKLAIDWLATLGGAEASLASFTDANATLLALFASPGAVLIGYGIARSGVSACTELRNDLFSKVTLRAIRSVSRMPTNWSSKSHN
ncbi:ABC transporter B family member 25, mitochondrial-like [Hordeum vulgare subsp. vulgare]|uniref:ABC transporter B family member 25, mitochondrial-like n=1 Tax=Hordeum vulgare subsp. vulgare TaxID=112509 RepID=UPI001D1A3B00|nr:ABC transporter B family member 25, mitochondrial-like [Hordeum vulgare subsp. vulgare]